MTPERWQQVDQMLEAVLELEVSERASHLAKACQGDEALRGEVEALLAHSDQAHSLIESSPSVVAAEALAEKRASSVIGRQLGHYEILALLGAGGMGEVYRARDTRLGRDVAIKILPAHLADNPEALARFEREAKAVAALSHRNILAIHHFATDDGLTYAAMELLEGQTLRARLARSVLTWRQAAEIAMAIAEGLSAAHAKGVVHRDLKPENVFLTSDGQVKILDFGLARLEPMVPVANPVATMRTNTTTPGLVMGTPGYMSPEQVRGEVAEAPSDIFSFGCILSEMLIGRAPFARPTVAETIAATLKDEPPALTGAGIPGELDVLLRRCLQKNPNDRFHSAQSLAAELKSIVSGARKSAPKRTFWVLSILALLVLGSVMGIRIYSGHRGRSATPESVRSIAILPFVNPAATPETEFLSDGITESLINSLSHAPELQVLARTTAFKYKGKEQDAKTVGRQLGVDAVVTGRALQEGDTLLLQAELVRVSNGSQLWGKRYNRKLTDVLALEEELAKAISDELRPHVTVEARQRVAKRYTDNTDAYQRYNQGRYLINKRTPKDVSKACEYFQQAITADPNYALAYAALAECYSIQGVQPYGGLAPTEVLPRARAAATKALALDDALAEAHAAMGHIKLVYDWDWLGAEREFQRAIELNPNYATAHQYYSSLLSDMERHDEAVREMKRALELDPLSLIMNNLLGFIFRQARQPDRAIKQGRMTTEMDPGFAAAHQTLGLAYEQKGMNEQAIAELETAVALSGGELASLASLGHIYAASGRRDDAQKILDELKELSVSGRRYVAPCLIARVLAGLGNKDQAFDWLEKSYQERSTCLGGLKVDAIMDNLRSDARFTDLLRRMNFPD